MHLTKRIRSRAAPAVALLALLTFWAFAACEDSSVGTPPKEFGEGCCTQPTFPDGQPCNLGICADGLECYLVPEGPNGTRGVCTTDCIQDACESADASCFFDRCQLLCDTGPNPPPDQCPEDLSCRLVHSQGFCIP